MTLTCTHLILTYKILNMHVNFSFKSPLTICIIWSILFLYLGFKVPEAHEAAADDAPDEDDEFGEFEGFEVIQISI